ncbi:amidase [Bdellovibrionota bacterium FG-1]
MEISQDLLNRTCLEQAALIAQKRLSSEELVRLYLAQIDRLNPKLQAFVAVYAQSAIREARRKDVRVRAGEVLPPFHGVPIGIKDLNFVRLMRTRYGSAGMLPIWAPFDDATVSPLRRAGFVILGKLATSEFGALPVTEPEIHPPTRNPWNPDYTAGGSSGGSAVAVSAGLLPVAHGSDGGGSIRIPASFTGLVGLKPARGRIPNQFNLSDRQILYTSGALTRTVDEAAALLDIMAGITDGKPHWATPPSQPFSQLARKSPGKLRIRVTYDSPVCKADPEVKAAIAGVAKTLSSLGHEVFESEGPSGATVEEFLVLWQFLIASLPLVFWSRVQPITRWLRDEGRKLKAKDVLKHHRELERRFLLWFESADLWLTPTVPVLAPRIGAFSQNEDPVSTFMKVAELGAFTAFCNVTGQPAISVPAGLSKLGIPIGAQLIGPPQGEAVILQVARQLEEALPWIHPHLTRVISGGT